MLKIPFSVMIRILKIWLHLVLCFYSPVNHQNTKHTLYLLASVWEPLDNKESSSLFTVRFLSKVISSR